MVCFWWFHYILAFVIMYFTQKQTVYTFHNYFTQHSLFQKNWNRFACFNAHNTHSFSHTVQCSSPVFPICFSSYLYKARPFPNTQSALIGQLTHSWASAANLLSSQVWRAFSLQLTSPLLWIKAWVMQMDETVTVWCQVTLDYWWGVSGAVFSVGEKSSFWCRKCF